MRSLQAKHLKIHITFGPFIGGVFQADINDCQFSDCILRHENQRFETQTGSWVILNIFLLLRKIQ